jgi:hypothetical protein
MFSPSPTRPNERNAVFVKRRKSKNAFERICALLLICCLLFLFIPFPSVQAAETFEYAAARSGVYLTTNGQANSTIMIPANASEKETYAAQELHDHIKLVSGASVPIIRGEPGVQVISMTLSLSKISTSEIGYHPFYVTVSNTTSNTEILTLSPNIATDGAPAIEIRGEDGREKGQIELPPNSQAIVYGLITIDEDVKYGSHPITIELKKGDAVVSSQIITVEYLEPNLLQNPGIENDSFTPWWQTASFFPDASEAHSGNKSIKFSGNHGADSGYNIRFPVRSGYAYELSFWAKRSSDSLAGVRMRITELDESVNLLRATEEIFELTDTWEKYTMAFYVDPELNPDYSFSWYNIYLVGDGTIWLDDFVLRELGKIEGYVKPSDPLPNIVRNGSFEEDSAWVYESGSSRIKYDDAIDGKYVLFVDMAAKEADNRHPYQSGLSVQKNHVYRLGFDAKRSGEDADGRIRFDLTPFPLGQGLPVIRMEVTPTEEWMRYEMLFVSPDDEIFNGSYWPDFFVPGSKGYLYVDNITLHDLGEATEPVDSTITSKPSVKTLPDGVGNGTIVPPSLGDKPEISPPDFNNIGNDGAVIFIAATDSYPDLALLYDEDVNFIGDSDGFAVRLTGNTVYIFGTNADGTLNGVYDFIETNLGVL